MIKSNNNNNNNNGGGGGGGGEGGRAVIIQCMLRKYQVPLHNIKVKRKLSPTASHLFCK